MTDSVEYELIVVDNASGFRTRRALNKMKALGIIDVLYYSSVNLLFAAGNNKAFSLSAEDSDMILLLNSDIEVYSKDW